MDILLKKLQHPRSTYYLLYIPFAQISSIQLTSSLDSMTYTEIQFGSANKNSVRFGSSIETRIAPAIIGHRRPLYFHQHSPTCCINVLSLSWSSKSQTILIAYYFAKKQWMEKIGADDEYESAIPLDVLWSC
jgi:hypothetical protein